MCAHLPRQRCGRDADTGRNAAQYKTLTYSVPTAKIEISGCIENIDLGLVPDDRNDRSVDGDFTFDLLLVEITDCISVFHSAESGSDSGEIRHSFCQ